jgi:hypothetical protein
MTLGLQKTILCYDKVPLRIIIIIINSRLHNTHLCQQLQSGRALTQSLSHPSTPHIILALPLLIIITPPNIKLPIRLAVTQIALPLPAALLHPRLEPPPKLERIVSACVAVFSGAMRVGVGLVVIVVVAWAWFGLRLRLSGLSGVPRHGCRRGGAW